MLELTPGGLGPLREAELRAAAATLGVSEVEVLGLGDSGMTGPPPAGSLCATPREALVRLLRDAIARHAPSVVVTLEGSDGHRDHLWLRDAVLAAVDPALPVYTHCLPRSLMHEWLRERQGDDAAAAYAGMAEIGTPDEDITTILEVGAHYATRLAAIAQHQSQASPYDGLSERLRRRFLASDHLRRVQPPWAGGAKESDLLGL